MSSLRVLSFPASRAFWTSNIETGERQMNTAKRRTVIAGNWKMNMTPSQAKALIEEMKPLVAGKDACDVVLCVPFVDIAAAV